MTDLYYEAHVTIEPVFDERLEEFKRICGLYGFRPAELLMKKRQEDTPERSKYDTFATARSKSKDQIISDTKVLCKVLHIYCFNVYRYKVEETILDSNYDNVLNVTLSQRSSKN